MKLIAGCELEYRKRHDEIWPELKQLLNKTGIKDYSIFLDRQTSVLFAVLKIEDRAALDAISLEPVMKRWWEYMKDIMETNPDHSPATVPLEEVFYLP